VAAAIPTQAEWFYIDTATQRDSSMHRGAIWQTRNGINHLQTGVAPSEAKGGPPTLAP